jgi:hypothetical protein
LLDPGARMRDSRFPGRPPSLQSPAGSADNNN